MRSNGKKLWFLLIFKIFECIKDSTKSKIGQLFIINIYAYKMSRFDPEKNSKQ